MIYAIRTQGMHRTLVETTHRIMASDERLMPVDRRIAHRWVRDGKEHETGLYIEDGKVRYAQPEMREV